MYSCFKLNLQNSDFIDWDLEYIEKYKKRGQFIKEELQNQVGNILSEVKNADSIIDGEKLSDVWFPIVKKDVFISYSHNDEDLALTIAGVLDNIFGLSVFIDTTIWGSADALLKAIDDEYCIKEEGNYDYTKRNFSTSHVHAMLTTSIMRAMDQAEVIFFLNTSNSIYKLKNGFTKANTLSPWIYEEIVCAKLLRGKKWEEHRTTGVDEVCHFEKSLNIAYSYDMDEYKVITFDNLIRWKEAWEKQKRIDDERCGTLSLKAHEETKHPLNVLYEMMFDVEEASVNL